ncbi:uncharacterized protein B0I36DRAFT_146120 [Microdochium trichocladiopsis]|uniref:Infection structure specific protein n=1 Tax=Microdochium trichocladiopsis TaxID=1682393 RepID=A0A9P9BNZ7_9PEZI|nr:uncharacterized protein B0I36DRAFT_146120 [Microdochium trichocladiopsis]KAH7027999.1 hypothetical protein B0I36DRAFT_146120 [Microdochium trichocladiopsis]
MYITLTSWGLVMVGNGNGGDTSISLVLQCSRYQTYTHVASTPGSLSGPPNTKQSPRSGPSSLPDRSRQPGETQKTTQKMRCSSTCVAASALVASAIATNVPQAEPARVVREFQPRQANGDGAPGNLLSSLLELANAFDLTVCIPGALSLVGELPPIPSGLVNNDIITQVLSQTTLASDQICDFSITGKAGEQMTSFLPTWYSWYSAYSSTIDHIISQYGCTKATSLVHTVEDYQTCPAVSGIIASGITAASTTTSTSRGPAQTSAATTTSSSRPAASSASTPAPAPPNGSPRQAGHVVAAAAVAGLAGLVAAL